ncbi:hypothetical protein [Bradyrhizobium roseum]|uniref:hypothetical protein n=1 Tax=Bradyrhizobium roseum TaxID=3056648 RepID=UPI002626B827|nr:hypothetical protein [Bradyrhizobium roseus]WKA29335.1 hypothetical protein QUH67_03850 [Bradyrhizobium roseus]
MTSKSKSRYQLDLLDEKRAFVVIALTDKLKQPASKLAAMNALAHYNSKEGYSWASVPTVAVESGYSATSTKTINAGLEEIEKVGAFKIKRTKGGAKNTHRICPVMSWFKAEYDLIRKSGKIANDNDDFADVRTGDDNPGPQPGLDDPEEEETQFQDQDNPGSEPGQPGSTTQATRAQNPTNPGSEPDEENKRNEQRETNREKRTNQNEQHQPACGERPAGVDDMPADWTEDWRNRFWDASPERKNVAATEKALIAIAKTGVKFESILIAARRRSKAEGFGYRRDPVKWLADEPWRDNAKAQKQVHRAVQSFAI